MRVPLDNSGYVKEQYRSSINLESRIALHLRFGTAPRRWFEWYFDHLALPSNARVLELGSGPVQIWNDNRTRIPADWELTLSDLSLGMLERAQAYGIAARFLQCDIQAIPFPAVRFDAVLANHMLYHVPDMSRALVEIRRVLKPGGSLYAATNGCDHMHELADLGGEFGFHPGSAALTFSLENGAEILAKHFPSVRRLDFADGLRVTETEPLVAYMLSMASATGIRGTDFVWQLREKIADRIARDGVIQITKSVGLFIARTG